MVILDLRSPSTARKGHIKGAYTFSLNELQSAKKRLPKKKSAPIVLYANNTEDAKRAFKVIRGWGYKNTSILEGGIASWTKLGNKLTQGALAAKIEYVPKPVLGAIKVAEFKKIAHKTPSDTLLLDVRDFSEAKSGMLKGALNIPTQDVPMNLHKIPKDRKVVVHCKTGVRASMVYETLKENGYNVRFLNAKIKIKPDGSYKIDI